MSDICPNYVRLTSHDEGRDICHREMFDGHISVQISVHGYMSTMYPFSVFSSGLLDKIFDFTVCWPGGETEEAAKETKSFLVKRIVPKELPPKASEVIRFIVSIPLGVGL